MTKKQMTKKQMTRDEEYDLYADPENQTPQGPGNLSEMVPVRFDPETLEALRAAAEADDRSVSSWIRRAVEHELGQRAG
jgi:predicted HicB family RNase H-like nuclease